MVVMFASTVHVCEQTFSIMKQTKSNLHLQMKDDLEKKVLQIVLSQI